MRRSLLEETVRYCSKCLRWQYLYQAIFIEFPRAVFRHLACVACGQAAWCRDMREGEDPRLCAHKAHTHAPGQCPGRPVKR